jgi:hypothetical protein
MDTRRRRRWIWLLCSLPLAICGAGVWLTPLSLAPRHRLAQSRWNAQAIRHYQLTAQLSEGWRLNGLWTIEIRDTYVIGGHDAGSGVPLDSAQLRTAQRVLPIDTLFDIIDDEINTPPLTSTFAVATRIARLGPPLREHLNHCAARLPKITYDQTLGYPRGVTVYGSPCVFGSHWSVLITDVTPLPESSS